MLQKEPVVVCICITAEVSLCETHIQSCIIAQFVPLAIFTSLHVCPAVACIPIHVPPIQCVLRIILLL